MMITQMEHVSVFSLMLKTPYDIVVPADGCPQHIARDSGNLSATEVVGDFK
jgi:hypothetical protein